MKITAIMIKIKIFLYFLLTYPLFTSGQLIRSNDVYICATKKIYTHYQSRYIVMLYAMPNLTISQNIVVMSKIVELQKYFNKMYIQTVITDTKTFASQHNENFNQLSHGLFVFLHDSEDVRNDFITILVPLINLARQTWLIFLDDTTNINDYFADFYIPFDCNFMVVQRNVNNNEEEFITEIFKIHRDDKLIEKIVGMWSLNTSLILPEKPLNQLRNFHGNALYVSVLNTISLKMKKLDNGTVIGISGIFGDIMNVIREKLNFTQSFHEVDSFGHILSNGTATGGLANLMYKETDIFPDSLWMMSNRIEKISYTVPILNQNFRMYIKTPSKPIDWDNFLLPFEDEVWIIIGCSVFVFTSTIALVIYIQKRALKNQISTEKKPPKFTDNFLAIIGALCKQDTDLDGFISTPNRIIYYTIHLTSLVLMAEYSAMLISSLTTYTYPPPFKSVHELIEDGSYTLGITNHPAHKRTFRPPNGSGTEDTYDEMLNDNRIFRASTYTEGLSRVCENERHAFIAEIFAAAHFKYQNCILYPSPVLTEVATAIGLQHNSPFRESFNILILLLRERGILRKIFNEYEELMDDMPEQMTAVDITDIIPLIVLLIANVFLSICFMITENIIQKKILRRRITQETIIISYKQKRIFRNFKNAIFRRSYFEYCD